MSPLNPLGTIQHFPCDLIFQLLAVFGALCTVAAYARPRYAADSFEYVQQHLYPTIYRQNQVTFCDCMPLNQRQVLGKRLTCPKTISSVWQRFRSAL